MNRLEGAVPRAGKLQSTAGASPAPESQKVHEKRYLNTREAAAYIGYSERSLADWRVKGGGPVYIQKTVRGKVTYDRLVLDQWLQGMAVASTSEMSGAAGVERCRDAEAE